MPTIIDGNTGVDRIKNGTVADEDFVAGLLAASFTTNGYAKLPGGLIVQWGVTPSGTSGTVTFPIAFPNNNFAVVPANNTTGNQSIITTRSTTQFTWTNSATTVTNWIAIGN